MNAQWQRKDLSPCPKLLDHYSLEDLARPYEMPEATLAATCTMRIISDEADLLFDALITADRALYKLMHSPMAEVAEENMGPFLRSFTILRKEVFGFQGDKRQPSLGSTDTGD